VASIMRLMRVELIAVGDELLDGQTVDTNSAWLGRRLSAVGAEVFWKTTVGDRGRDIVSAVRLALKRADLTVVTGGLGPTGDDVTVEAVAKALGLPLQRRPAIERKIRSFLSGRGIEVLPGHLKQALLPRGCRVMQNDVGTAPGFTVQKRGSIVAALPGVPMEMRAMAERRLLPFVRGRITGRAARWRVLKFVGIGETALEQRIGSLAGAANPKVAFLPQQGEVHLRLTATAPTERQAQRLIEQAQAKVIAAAGEFFIGSDDETLESAIGELLRQRKLTLAIAESCTGGLIGNMITNVPGSSDYFLMGVIAYSNEAKAKMLGVRSEMIARHGAVSAEVATAMAQGVRRRAGADVAIAVTGIAGPTGGTKAKPVGLVYIAASGEGWTVVKENRFAGDREAIKRRSAITALALLRSELLARASKPRISPK